MKFLNLNIVATLFCWGVWGISDKKALEYGEKEDIIVRLYLISFLFIPFAFFALNAQQPGWQFGFELLLWSGLASLSYMVSMFAYLAAMTHTEASYVLGITAAYPLVFQLLAALFLGETVVAQRLIGAAVIAFGLFFVGGSDEAHGAEKDDATPASGDLLEREITNASLNSDTTFKETNSTSVLQREPLTNAVAAKPVPSKAGTIACLLLATFAWGVYGLFDKKAVGVASPLLVYFSKALWDFVSFFVIFPILLRRRKIDWKQPQAWVFSACSELALAVGGLTYLAALASSSASYVITITGCYPILMYIFALLFLKERFNKLRFFGISLVVLGGIIVQLVESV